MNEEIAKLGTAITVGLCLGMSGWSFGQSSMRNKIKRQLTQSLSDGAISIKDSSGTDVSADQLLDLLGKKYKNA